MNGEMSKQKSQSVFSDYSVRVCTPQSGLRNLPKGILEMRLASLRLRKLYAIPLLTGSLCGLALLLAYAARIKPLKFEGLLTVDGKPVKNALITFVPDNKGPIANARTGKDGKFRLTTWTEGDGILPGDYQVCVVQLTTAPDEEPGEPVPTVYSDPFRSPLRCRVPPPEGKITIDMKSAADKGRPMTPGFPPGLPQVETEGYAR